MRCSCRLSSFAVCALFALGAPASAVSAPTVAEHAAARVVTVLSPAGLEGTAFAYGSPNELVTNAHVVGSARSVELTTPTGRHVRAEVIALDPGHDLALLRSPLTLQPLSPRVGRVHIGEAVIVIGSPLGLQGSVATGVVSGLNRPSPASIQIDVPVNPGNSGGPLLDGRGRVIGITTATASDGQGIAFAIPASQVGGLAAHRLPPAPQPSNFPWFWLAVAALLALLAMAVVLALRLRSRESKLKVVIRPASTPAAPITAYEPEPRVRLKSRD